MNIHGLKQKTKKLYEKQLIAEKKNELTKSESFANAIRNINTEIRQRKLVKKKKYN